MYVWVFCVDVSVLCMLIHASSIGWAKFGQFGGPKGEEEVFCEPYLLTQLDAMLGGWALTHY